MRHHRTPRPLRPRCVFLGLIFAWVVAIYLPSALIGAFGFSPTATGLSIAAATWEIADEVAPLAKIGYAFLFSAFALGARRAGLKRPLLIATDILSAAAAMLLVLALLPEDWSRGFGITLSGTRFAPGLTLVYLIGAAASGLTFTLADAKCRNRDYPEDSSA